MRLATSVVGVRVAAVTPSLRLESTPAGVVVHDLGPAVLPVEAIEAVVIAAGNGYPDWIKA